MAQGPRAQGARDIVPAALPTIRFDRPIQPENALRTRGPSLSATSIDWDGKIGTWNTFYNEVESKYQELRQVGILGYTDSNPPPQSLSLQHYICGEEKGIEARFISNVLHVMSAVAGDQNKNVRFGDFRSTQENREQPDKNKKYPDFAAMTETQTLPAPERHRLRFVGEAKADWQDHLYQNYRIARADARRGGRLCDWLRQLAQYMSDFNLKYGFLTTYLYTIFVKYAARAEDNGGQAVILVSEPISWDTIRNPARREVSVRQGMWFLMHEVTGTGNRPWRYSEKADGTDQAKLLYEPEQGTRTSERHDQGSSKDNNTQARGGTAPSSSKNAGMYEEDYGRQTFCIDPSLGTRISDQKLRHLRSLNETQLHFEAPTRKKEAYFWVEDKKKMVVRVEPEHVTFYRGLRMLTLSYDGDEVVRLRILDKTMKDLCASNMDVSSFMRRHIASCGR